MFYAGFREVPVVLHVGRIQTNLTGFEIPVACPAFLLLRAIPGLIDKMKTEFAAVFIKVGAWIVGKACKDRSEKDCPA